MQKGREPEFRAQPGSLRPARTPEERENQLIAIAYDLVERRIMEGTATSQEVVHFLKLGTTRNQLEQEKLALESELLKAKKERLDSEERTEAMYAEAIEALSDYKGSSDNV